MKSITYELSEIESAASLLISEAGEEKVWVFQGSMGAGKTTLIKALADKFGILDQVSSPTFGIVNQYENQEGNVFYHFDFYRLDDPTEALDIGIEEYFYSGNYCWIEWAEKIEAFLPENFFLIKIESISDLKRQVTFQHIHDAI
ncbi:MAG: tRNA (adenosine(37)-N6)-threonylcarbamoyltransferase complex ATPase subunit type 1 TsaE [Algoriphagus sp.]|nr:tRNA (adenosine(37)-N6)-threonylcarbamoyltransferase complex ATPase subunit type 1 TsaE [Algoriphagus sp.]